MKRHQLLAMTKTCLLAVAGMLMASCADTYDGKDSFQYDVRNTVLASPSEADITITPSTDGSHMDIEWPVVFGAGGYQFKLLNASDETKPLVNDTIIDGCKLTVSREEDMNYKIVLRTIGNTKLNNSDAPTATEKLYSTFAASFATIPDGSDLYQYFQENPLPDAGNDGDTEEEGEETVSEFIFDLVPGGNYTVSQPVNFDYKKVILRTADKTNHAAITLDAGANFIASNDLTLNYVDIDASATEKPLVEAYNYSENPDGILEKPGNYYLINFVRIMNSNVTGLVGSLFYDNNKSWCVVNFLIKTCVILLNTKTDAIKNQALISFQGGGAKDFSISNSTVYQGGEGNSNYFIRYNNSARVDRFGWTTADHTTMTYTNNTFYKVASSQWGNYSGISNYSTYDARYNIWYDCADGNIARRMMGNGRLGNNASANWVSNTYWNSTTGQVDQGTYDASGTALTTDPAFVDAANGILTPTGAEQVENKTGDPRWYAVSE